MAEGRRFETFSDEQIQQKIRNTVPKNTKKSNKSADKILKDYLSDKGYTDLDYVNYSKEKLNSILKNFWFEARQKKKKNDDPVAKPELYSKATLQNIRHAINRNIHDAGKYYDITTDEAFGESENAYKAACKELKEKGRAVVNSYPEIVHAGQ